MFDNGIRFLLIMNIKERLNDHEKGNGDTNSDDNEQPSMSICCGNGHNCLVTHFCSVVCLALGGACVV